MHMCCTHLPRRPRHRPLQRLLRHVQVPQPIRREPRGFPQRLRRFLRPRPLDLDRSLVEGRGVFQVLAVKLEKVRVRKQRRHVLGVNAQRLLVKRHARGRVAAAAPVELRCCQEDARVPRLERHGLVKHVLGPVVPA